MWRDSQQSVPSGVTAAAAAASSNPPHQTRHRRLLLPPSLTHSRTTTPKLTPTGQLKALLAVRVAEHFHGTDDEIKQLRQGLGASLAYRPLGLGLVFGYGCCG